MTLRSLALALTLPMALTACSDGGSTAPGEELRSSKQRDPSPDVSAEDQAALVAGGNDFAIRLHQQVAAGDAGNLIYSPLSMSTALAMLYAGARGNTETQMATALGFTLPQDRLHAAMNWLDLELAARADVPPGPHGGLPFKLNVVNRLWGQIGFPFLPTYLDTLGVNYGAGMQLVDFDKDKETARLAINDWVSDETNQRIPELLAAADLDGSPVLVLTNAVYFIASWKEPFEENDTRDKAFHTLGSGDVTVPTMFKGDMSGAYAAGDGYFLAELPYAGDQVALTLLVPDAGRFTEIESSLTGAKVATMIAGLQPTALAVTLPRFQFEGSFEVPQALEALGMTDVFDYSKADLSGIDGGKDLYVETVVHKAFIKVDEKGTEAAAATGVVAGDAALPETTDAKVDRPFLFFLRDRVTGTILFVGRVTNPAL